MCDNAEIYILREETLLRLLEAACTEATERGDFVKTT